MTTEATTEVVTTVPAIDDAAVAAAAAAAKPATAIDPNAKPAPKGEPEVITYEETGDPKLDLALDFFGRNGLGPDHAAIKAAIDGDFSFLEAYLDEKNVQGWKSYVGLAKEAHGNVVKAATEREASIQGAVSQTLEQHGYTPEQWNEAINWVRTEAADEVPEINKLLASGPLGAKAITAYILHNHREASGTEYTPQAKAVKEEAGANAGGKRELLTPITKSEFSREAEKLSRSFGPDYLTSPEYKVLRQRAGIGQR